MQTTAPAKINLTFKVKSKRSDGLHDLESIVAFADISDEITIEPTTELTYEVNGPYAHHVPQDSGDDLVVKAVKLFEKETNQTVNQRITLTKNIPAGAGLGGGSSDAATILKSLNTLYDTKLSEDELCEIGVQLGNDVPVCIRARPTLVEGTGDRLSDTQLPYEGTLLLVWPNTHCSTQAVFEAFDTKPPQENYPNDLTLAAMSLCPMISECLDTLSCYEDANQVSMSGSGSTCFAVFDSHENAEKHELALKNKYPQWWIQVTQLLS